jgi:penicillin amidase
MKKIIFIVVAFFCLTSCVKKNFNYKIVKGLHDTVEIIRDSVGINHIYAKNQYDLFFTQGYAAAKDRLFQFEIWRRQANGTLAEILGEKEFSRDLGVRLFKFRGDIVKEMNHYHKDGVDIITAYTNGVNSYIEEVLNTPERLPIEFKILKIFPKKWTPEIVISRHQGLLGNIEQEFAIGNAVSKVGSEKVKELMWFHPKDPNLELDYKLKNINFSDSILFLYNSFRKKVSFDVADIDLEYRSNNNVVKSQLNEDKQIDILSIGSNNWVLSEKKTLDGNTYMANDPHRTIAVPSLRYMVHLVAPGWNVIGGGEPEIPGVSIGHNDYGAWGLTVFRTDGEDLYVYDLNPKNIFQYRYKDKWVDMKVIEEKIKIKNKPDKNVKLYYTHHGPVTYLDKKNNKAYAIRCAWLEIGGSPYLASLRMNQAKNWKDFKDACNYSNIPGENMLWADKKGNIGWQAVGIAPVRDNFSGLVPVPGDGRYEWNNYLEIIKKPNKYNPKSGFIATANQNLTPDDYKHWNSIGFLWSDPYRGDRINKILSSNSKINFKEMRSLQIDYFSVPASILTKYLKPLKFKGIVLKAKERLENWDYELNPNSIEAAIYVVWENEIKKLANEKFIPKKINIYIKEIQLKKIIDWIINPGYKFGKDSKKSRDDFLKLAFRNAIDFLINRLGSDIEKWKYGQKDLKHSYIRHYFSGLVKKEIQDKLDLGPIARGGNGYTIGSTGNNFAQSSGASFRIIVNTGDWDAAIGTNTPGQSGNPESYFYSNLYDSWAKDKYFPVYFSKEKVSQFKYNEIILRPN